MWAMRVHQEGRNDLQLAAVGPTSDSALPIRAELFGGPDIVGTKPPLSPKIRDFRGPRDFALPILSELYRPQYSIYRKPLERRRLLAALQRNGTIWNLKPPGTPEGLLEQSRRLNLERALAQAKARESVDGS